MLSFKCKCPHCHNEANHNITAIAYYKKIDDKTDSVYTLIKCSYCEEPFIAIFNLPTKERVEAQKNVETREYRRIFTREYITYPEPKQPPTHESYPDKINSLIKEIEKVGEPFAKISFIRSALEFALIDIGIKSDKDSLFDAIQKAYEKRLITAQLADWAHIVRKFGNKAIHEIEATESEAQEAYDFLKLFLKLIYEIPAVIRKYSNPASSGNKEE